MSFVTHMHTCTRIYTRTQPPVRRPRLSEGQGPGEMAHGARGRPAEARRDAPGGQAPLRARLTRFVGRDWVDGRIGRERERERERGREGERERGRAIQ